MSATSAKVQVISFCSLKTATVFISGRISSLASDVLYPSLCRVSVNTSDVRHVSQEPSKYAGGAAVISKALRRHRWKRRGQNVDCKSERGGHGEFTNAFVTERKRADVTEAQGPQRRRCKNVLHEWVKLQNMWPSYSQGWKRQYLL